MGLAGQGGGISSAFQFDLQPKYSGGVWTGRRGRRRGRGDRRACCAPRRFAAELCRHPPPHLPRPPLLPRAGFPGHPHSPPHSSLSGFCLGFPQEKGYMVVTAQKKQNTVFLMRSLGKKQGRSASFHLQQLKLFQTFCTLTLPTSTHTTPVSGHAKS